MSVTRKSSRPLVLLERALGKNYGTVSKHPMAILTISIVLAVGLSVALFYVGRSMIAVGEYTRNALPDIRPAPAGPLAFPDPRPQPLDPLEQLPISIAVTNGSLDDIAIALTATTGVKFGSPASPPAEHFTVVAAEQPFWKVQEQLTALHVAWSSPARVLAISTSIQDWHKAPPTHGVSVFLSHLAKGAAPARGASSAAPPFTGTMALSVDPRMEVVKARPPEFDEATDDLGNHWRVAPQTSPPPADITALSSWDEVTFQRPIHFFPATANGLTPAAPKMLKVLRGQMRVLVQIESDMALLEDLPNQFNKPLAQGPFEFVLTHVAPRSNSTTTSLVVRPFRQSESVDTTLPINILYHDDTHTAWGLTTLQPAGLDVRTINIPTVFPPLASAQSITMRFPTKVREVAIPFEFHDLPLP